MIAPAAASGKFLEPLPRPILLHIQPRSSLKDIELPPFHPPRKLRRKCHRKALPQPHRLDAPLMDEPLPHPPLSPSRHLPPIDHHIIEHRILKTRTRDLFWRARRRHRPHPSLRHRRANRPVNETIRRRRCQPRLIGSPRNENRVSKILPMQDNPAPRPSPRRVASRVSIPDRTPPLKIAERHRRPLPSIDPQHRPRDHPQQRLVNRHVQRRPMRRRVFVNKELRKPGAHD